MRFQPTRQSTRRVSCPVINNNQLTVPCVGSVKSGDSVMIITRNGEPVAVAPIGWGDAVESDISDAATKATSYITDIDSGGVTVHPSDDSTTGVQITEDVDIMRGGTSVINIGTDDAVRVGVAGENNIAITDSGVSFSMPYDDGSGHTGTVAASMYPEYGSYTNAHGYTFTVPVFHITHGTTDLKLYSGGRAAIDSDISAANIEATETIHALDEITVGDLTALLAPRVTLADGTVKMGNRYGSSVLSVNSDGNLDISTPIVTDAVNGLYARATGTSSAANYFTLINADTGVGVQFIFNPSTRNLAVRYTTNGGTNWSSAKTIASWS